MISSWIRLRNCLQKRQASYAECVLDSFLVHIAAAESRTIPNYVLSNCCSITLLLLGGSSVCAPFGSSVDIVRAQRAALRRLRPTRINKCPPPQIIRELTSISHNRDPEYCLLPEKRNSARKPTSHTPIHTRPGSIWQGVCELSTPERATRV